MLEWVVKIGVATLLAMVAVATLVPEADRAAAIGDARDRVVEQVVAAFTQGQDKRMAVYDELASARITTLYGDRCGLADVGRHVTTATPSG